MLELLEKLLRQYHINIQQIINNSDNTYEDIKNDAYIVLYENYDDIINDNKVFINKLKARCLKFNKYGKRIESCERWKYFNDKEDIMNSTLTSYDELNEGLMCSMIDIENIVGKNDYKFLIYYYNHGHIITAKHYNMTETSVRKKVSNLLIKIRKWLKYD